MGYIIVDELYKVGTILNNLLLNVGLQYLLIGVSQGLFAGGCLRTVDKGSHVTGYFPVNFLNALRWIWKTDGC